MKSAVYEPEGIFRIETIQKPLFAAGKVWFTQTFNGVYQLHVGIFVKGNATEGRGTLKVWKTRDIKPRRKTTLKGWQYHKRNPLLDQPIYETIVSVPFLQKATI